MPNIEEHPRLSQRHIDTFPRGIRRIKTNDFDDICEMLLEFRKYTELEALCNLTDRQPIYSLLSKIVRGQGIGLTTNNLDGVLIGVFSASPWSDRVTVLNELAFFIKEESRGKRIGFKLLSTYIDEARRLKELGRIHLFNFGEISISPDYSKFGLIKGETNWYG